MPDLSLTSPLFTSALLSATQEVTRTRHNNGVWQTDRRRTDGQAPTANNALMHSIARVTRMPAIANGSQRSLVRYLVIRRGRLTIRHLRHVPRGPLLEGAQSWNGVKFLEPETTCAFPFICQIVAAALGISGISGVVCWTLTMQSMLFRYWNLWRNTWSVWSLELKDMKNQSQKITYTLLLNRKTRCSTKAISRQHEGDISESPGIVQNAGVFANYTVYEPVVELFGFLYSIFWAFHLCLCAHSAQNQPKILNRRCRMRLLSSYHNATSHVTQRSTKPNSFEHYCSIRSQSPALINCFSMYMLHIKFYLTLMVANCSGEHSFLAMSRVKSQPMWSQSTNVTDRQTDDMRSQYRALH